MENLSRENLTVDDSQEMSGKQEEVRKKESW